MKLWDRLRRLTVMTMLIGVANMQMFALEANIIDDNEVIEISIQTEQNAQPQSETLTEEQDAVITSDTIAIMVIAVVAVILLILLFKYIYDHANQCDKCKKYRAMENNGEKLVSEKPCNVHLVKKTINSKGEVTETSEDYTLECTYHIYEKCKYCGYTTYREEIRYDQANQCGKCKQYRAMEDAGEEMVSKKPCSVKKIKESRNKNGEVTQTSEVYVPGTAYTYRIYQKCKYCGDIIYTEDIRREEN
ncbi:hypothetical protein AGMMS50229_10850 [Campylobacterota bacterium]|nr:hypothetical protein AGMMS50229_10850 [Campylobacterota bacterium]